MLKIYQKVILQKVPFKVIAIRRTNLKEVKIKQTFKSANAFLPSKSTKLIQST